MQRKKIEKSNYPMFSSPQNYKPLYNQHTSKQQHLQQNHQNFFMKYASSIIQVLNEEKLQKSNPLGTQLEQKSPIYDISEVKQYEMDMLHQNSERKKVESNNYNNQAQGFKKKNNKKYILMYNFSNITLFVSHIAKVQNNRIKNVFSSLKNVSSKPKYIKNQPPISKSSFQSDYTACTSNEENRVKKLSNFYKQLKRSQEAKEGIYMIKGWVEFRVLLIKNYGFREIKSYSNSKEAEKKQLNLRDSLNIPLGCFANDESLFLGNHEQSSLTYTADQNFQLSQKQIGLSTPQKSPMDYKLNHFALNRQLKANTSQFSMPKSHWYVDIDQVYKLNHMHTSSFQQKMKPKVSSSNPIFLNFETKTKTCMIRTNTFQLPLISQFYLRDENIPKQNQAPLKRDNLLQTQAQLQIPNDQLLKQFQICKKLLFKQTTKSQLKSKIFLGQDKSSKFNVESSKTVKMTQTNTQKNGQQLQIKNVNHQKKRSYKVQEYYFPGAQSRIDKLIQTKSRIKIIGDKPTPQCEKLNLPTHSTQQSSATSQNIRIQESLVTNFPLQSQSRFLKGFESQKDTTIKNKQKKITFNTSIQQRLEQRGIPKMNGGLNSPLQRMAISPLNSNNSENYQMKRKHYFSPPSTLRHFQNQQETQRNHLMSKPNIPKQHKQVNPVDLQSVHPNNEKQMRMMQNNIYQFNYVNQQQKPVQNNLNNYYHRIDNRNANLKTVKQVYQSPSCKVVQQNLINRPTSKIGTLPNHLNMPIRKEHVPYRIATSRQALQKKVSFHSPQANRSNHVQMIVTQPNKPQQVFSTKREDYNYGYFVRQNLTNKSQEPAVNFNNKYYTLGATVPPRPHQILSPQVIQPNLYPEIKSYRTLGSQRPHSSFRQSSERFNIFSNYSLLESQIQSPIYRQNHISNRERQLKRPKSMNDKVHMTMFRER